MHMHSGHGPWAWLQWLYNKLEYTICDVYRPCHSILSILRPVFAKLDRFIVLTTRSVAKKVTRSLNLAIFISMTMMTTQLIALPLAHACGVISIIS